MKKLVCFVAALLICFTFSGCLAWEIPNPFYVEFIIESDYDNETRAADASRYHFESIDNDHVIENSYNLIPLYGDEVEDLSKEWTLTQGRLLTLFGTPFYESAEYNYPYDYAIRVTDDESGVWYLSVYHSHNGPFIATTSTNEKILEVAYAFYAKVMETPASDFDYVGYNPEIRTRVRKGVVDGIPYYKTDILKDPEEIQEMYDILGRGPEFSDYENSIRI